MAPQNTILTQPIDILNQFYEEVSSMGFVSVRIEGSIDELLRENPRATCTDCGKSLVREQYDFRNGRYVGGIIRCLDYDQQSHQRVGWLEIWQIHESKDPSVNNQPESREDMFRRFFIGSDPRIKECYGIDVLDWHELFKQKANEQGMAWPESPNPSYIHCDHDSR
jgi:hypothetical protein